MRNFDVKKALNKAPWRSFICSKTNPSYLKPVLVMLIIVSTVIFSCRRLAPTLGNNTATTSKDGPLQTHAGNGDEFMIAVVGDTQNYVDESAEEEAACQSRQQFQDQIDWIRAKRIDSNIVYVVSVGDITDEYYVHDSSKYNYWDKSDSVVRFQWKRAYNIYQGLKTDGIPFGVVPGNHDVDNQPPFYTNPFFKHYFGRAQFGSYNKGDFPVAGSNVNHYDMITTAGGTKLMFVYLRWHHDPAAALDAYNWAYDVINANPTYKAIVITHYTAENQDVFTNVDDGIPDGKMDWGIENFSPALRYSQAERIYNKLKALPNFFLFLGGHVGGEGYRQDTYDGITVKTYTADYQSCSYTPGLLRTMKFSADKDRIYTQTFIPNGTVRTQSYSTFMRPWAHGFTTSRTNDYDNDAKSQAAFFSGGTWTIQALNSVTFGASNDIAIPGDYNGDGKTDQAVFVPGGTWKFNISGYTNVSLGVGAGDIPVPGDYDDNGSTDCAIYRPSNQTFYVRQKYKDTSSVVGAAGDIPVSMDYNGDGKVDFATFSPTTAIWSIPGISNSQYGVAGDIPVPGDYNGNGRNTRAVYRQSNHGWYVYGAASNPVTIGQSGDIPVPGDYNGDGKTDMAVYRPTTGQIIINGQSTISTGVTNGKPLNLPYHIRKFFFP